MLLISVFSTGVERIVFIVLFGLSLMVVETHRSESGWSANCLVKCSFRQIGKMEWTETLAVQVEKSGILKSKQVSLESYDCFQNPCPDMKFDVYFAHAMDSFFFSDYFLCCNVQLLAVRSTLI